MFNSIPSSRLNLENPLFQLIIGLILSTAIWFVWGLRPNQIIGTNDIAHHLLTLKIGSQSFPHFTPIYDWLWMGGQLVAPNVGHVPIERVLLFLGADEGIALTATILFFHATVFAFCFDLFQQKANWSIIESVVVSLSLSFAPSTITRIIFGHTSLYFPIAFMFYLLWLLNSKRFHWFYFFLGILFGVVTLSGPSFQLVFYFVFFIFPFILIFNFLELKARWKHLLVSLFLPLFLSLDFFFLTYNYVLKSGDLFRSSENIQLLYSYARLNLSHLYDFFSLSILNQNKDNYFLFHETKYFLGLSTILLIYKNYSKKLVLISTFFLLAIFLFITPIFGSLEHLFSHLPGFNMFRIPQRIFLLLSPLLIFYSFFSLGKNECTDRNEFWLIVFIVAFLSFFHSLIWLDLALITFTILYLTSSHHRPSQYQLLSILLISFVFYGFQFLPRTTSAEMLNVNLQIQPSISRTNILNSPAWGINSNRFYDKNSAFGYTHPLPRFRTIYQETFNHKEVDQLFFSPRKTESLNSYTRLFRYHQTKLSFSPKEIKDDQHEFALKLQNGTLDPSITSYVGGAKMRACTNPVVVDSERITNGSLILNIQNPNNFECLVVTPFNFTTFLKAFSGANKVQLFPINYTQIGFNVPANQSTITISPNYSLYWKVKFVGIFLAVFLFLFYLKYIKRDFNNF